MSAYQEVALRLVVLGQECLKVVLQRVALQREVRQQEVFESSQPVNFLPLAEEQFDRHQRGE